MPLSAKDYVRGQELSSEKRFIHDNSRLNPDKHGDAGSTSSYSSSTNAITNLKRLNDDTSGSKCVQVI